MKSFLSIEPSIRRCWRVIWWQSGSCQQCLKNFFVRTFSPEKQLAGQNNIDKVLKIISICHTHIVNRWSCSRLSSELEPLVPGSLMWQWWWWAWRQNLGGEMVASGTLGPTWSGSKKSIKIEQADLPVWPHSIDAIIWYQPNEKLIGFSSNKCNYCKITIIAG